MLNFFFFNDTATTEIYTLSLHDALPISDDAGRGPVRTVPHPGEPARDEPLGGLSDHDGLVRAADARGRCAVCAHAPLQSRRGARADARRHPGGTVRRLHREIAAHRVAALAGGDRGHVRGGPDAGVGAARVEGRRLSSAMTGAAAAPEGVLTERGSPRPPPPAASGPAAPGPRAAPRPELLLRARVRPRPRRRRRAPR